MPTVKFLGRVLPFGVAQINIGTPTLHWEETAGRGLVADITVRIRDSVVEIECVLNRDITPDDFTYLFFRAFDAARASVDLIAFSVGFGLTVSLESFANERGETAPIVPQDTRLPALCTAFNLDDIGSYDVVWRVVATTPPLFMALNDLISAIALPHYGPRVAGQVTETLRGLLAPPGLEPRQQWPHMQRLLNVDRRYLQYISDNATGPRHGDRSHIPPDVTRELAVRAWTLMNRYLEFRKRGGNDQLPEAQFPILV